MKVWFCAGSSTSSSALERIALERDPELVGFVQEEHRVLGSQRASCSARCGPAARRRTSGGGRGCRASSRTPPSAMRTYFRPRARATDLAMDVLPTPGRPTKSVIGPRSDRASALVRRPPSIRILTERTSSSTIPSRPRARSGPLRAHESPKSRVEKKKKKKKKAYPPSGCSRGARSPTAGRCESPGLPWIRGPRARAA